LQVLEDWDDHIYDIIVNPLRKLCQLQIEHGRLIPNNA
jgi:hypothetical protein